MSLVAVVLSLAGACGGSSRYTPASQQSDGGTGGSAGSGAPERGGSAGRGGRGGVAGSSTGGTTPTAGATGIGGGGIGGTSAAGGGGAGASSAGSSGAGASSAGSDGAGGASLSEPFRPPWLPSGQFGESAERLINASTDYVFWLCVSSGLPPDTCTRAELHNFAPSLEWLACASRTSGANEMLDEIASGYAACAGEQRACGRCFLVCDVMIPDLPECPRYQSHDCPSGGVFAYRCDDGDGLDCSDGYDQRNCDRAAPRYDCGDGRSIPWTAVCDDAADCESGVDEFRCGWVPGEGGAAGAAANE